MTDTENDLSLKSDDLTSKAEKDSASKETDTVDSQEDGVSEKDLSSSEAQEEGSKQKKPHKRLGDVIGKIVNTVFCLPSPLELFEIIPIAIASAVFLWSLLTDNVGTDSLLAEYTSEADNGAAIITQIYEMDSDNVGYALVSLALIEGMAVLMLVNSKVLSYLSWVLVVIAPAASCLLLESMLHDVFGMEAQIVFLNILFYVLLAFLMLFLTRRTWVAIFVPAVVALVCGLAEYYVVEFRSSPIFPWDLWSLGTAAEVVDNYTFTMPFELSTVVIGMIFIIFLAFRTHTKIYFPGLKSNIIVRAVGCVIFSASMIFYVAYLNTDSVYDDFGMYRYLFTPNYMYNKNGFTAAFISNLRYIIVDKPSGYSEEALYEIWDKYYSEDSTGEDTGNDSSNPNIIMIMNEAFSDLTIYGDFETNTEIMPFIWSLYESDDTITGWLHVSVLGGNTANTEFEALTGMSMAYLPTGSIPYQQYIKDTLPSLASQLADNGYYTVSMHPYGATGWNRDTVYECFGFFRSDFLSDFTSTRILRKYVSDTSVYNRILKTLRAKTEDSDAPYFIFAVTMQNHSSYSTTYDNFDYDAVTATGLEDVTKLSQYLSLIRESDEALESLISSLETFEEDTIVVFFGDHQPAASVYSKLLTLYGITLDEENSLSDQEMRYTIPIIIWANYDIDEETYEYVSNLVSEGISANYTSTLVSLTAGIELTSHQEFLNTLINYYPVITSNVIIDSDGNYYSSYSSGDYLNSDVGGSEMLSEYAMLEYYYLFDGSNGYDFWE